MVKVSGPWTEAGVRSFLHEVTVPIRLAVRRPDGTPWIVALWFRHIDGQIECASEARTHLVRMLRADPVVGFDVSTNEIPYRGIRGSGTVSLAPDEDFVALRALIERYLGDAESPLAQRLLDDDRREARIRIDPDRIHSWDFTERMRGISQPAN